MKFAMRKTLTTTVHIGFAWLGLQALPILSRENVWTTQKAEGDEMSWDSMYDPATQVAKMDALRVRVAELTRELGQVQRWVDGLVTETQRLQGIEQRAEQAEARLASVIAACPRCGLLSSEVARESAPAEPQHRPGCITLTEPTYACDCGVDNR
jgi:hypothetical protein